MAGELARELSHRPVILVVGGGYVGLYTALRLQKKLSRGRAEIVVVDPQPHMTYQPFLPEAAAGSVEPRHVVVMAAGSVARTLPIPGLAEHGVGFKNVGEAIYLRNHVLSRLDAASSTDDPAVRAK